MAPAILTQRPKILYLDAYDSFSNNIIALVEQCIDADVIKATIDDPVLVKSCSTHMDPNAKELTSNSFADFVKNFDGVIAGPGPGWAKCGKDVGLMNELWKLQEEDIVPVLGICLGFQSMCLAFGAEIQRLKEPRHGLIDEVLHKERSIFRNVDQLMATQYHSLQVIIDHPIQIKRAVRYPAQLWEPTETCPKLEPLAWDFDSKENGAVLMGAKHTEKPFWGVQFHPESICTNSEGIRIIQNWWEDSQSWLRNRTVNYVKQGNPPSLSQRNHFTGIPPTTHKLAHSKVESVTENELASLIAHGDGKLIPDLAPSTVHCATTGSGRLTVSDVVELFEISRNEAIILESGLQPDLLPMGVGTGRYSIIGFVIPGETLRLHYYAGSRIMQLRDGKDKVHVEWKAQDPWPYFYATMRKLKPTTPPQTPTWAPFWGGLMGYVSYEAGLETIDVDVHGSEEYPDICFAYITRSVVFDHQVKKIYVQSIRGSDDMPWVNDTLDKIYEAVGRKSEQSTPSGTPNPKEDPFEQDATLNQYIDTCKQLSVTRADYCESVRSCQEAIADGQSYELCLTTTNEIHARKPPSCKISRVENNELSWKLYKRLAGQNPAPFGAYMRMHNVHILSSSPERYISWDRSQTAQCRPIKGTVQKKPGVTAADAHDILSTPKERAENLMIVDLVRHQLHGVYGSKDVHVRQLMEVEEYETLWQLVTVIDAVPRGICKPSTPGEWEDPADYVSVSGSENARTITPYLGFNAFVKSLPPGSMTGAPKKRSCEILQKEENGEKRGIYSGVLGYLDVGGGGDFNVIIRTAFKIDSQEQGKDIWRLGAGGAVTSQSTPDGEYEEMVAKFQSTSRAFKHQSPTERRESKSKLPFTIPANQWSELESEARRLLIVLEEQLQLERQSAIDDGIEDD